MTVTKVMAAAFVARASLRCPCWRRQEETGRRAAGDRPGAPV